MINEKGFSLLEVLGSLVILTIIFLSFFQIFINSNKIAAVNNEKLVMIYLADANLERTKIDPFEHLPKIDPKSNSLYKETKAHKISLNDKEYTVTLNTTQNLKEKELNMFNIEVKVTSNTYKSSSSVEGYVIYE